MGLQEWPCDVKAQEDDINPRVSDLAIVQNPPLSPSDVHRGTAMIPVQHRPH
ncbi:hypothetical protein QW131_26745 [Roseibium salinum]|nr:hypothetical protein [Roseibium salinum]